MVGKSNLPSDAENRPGLRGSSLRRYGNALDQKRAASMADEGGAAAVIADALDHEWAAPAVRVRVGRSRPFLWCSLAALGLAALAAGVWRSRRA